MTAPAVVVLAIGIDELRSLVREEVRAAVADLPPASPAPLLARGELARLLDVSTATVARLTAEGMPVVHVGDSPRFDVEAVRLWLGARGRQATKAAPSKSTGPVAGVRLLSRGSR